MSEHVEIRVYVKTDRVGSKCEAVERFDREQWESMSDAEREECALDIAWNMAEWGWSEVDNHE